MDLFRWQNTAAPVKVGDPATFGGKTGTVTLIGRDIILLDGKPVSPHLLGAEPIYPTGAIIARPPPQTLPKGSNPELICPHCQTKGFVVTERKKVKQGISGAKAVAAVVTSGLSMITPGIGLSRKETVTEATCGHCKSTWRF